MFVFFKQPLMRVLTGYAGEIFRDQVQLGDRRKPPIDINPASFGEGYDPADNDPV